MYYQKFNPRQNILAKEIQTPSNFMWLNATREEQQNIIQRYIDMNSQYYTRQKNFLTQFLENYQIIDKDRTQVAIQCYNGDDLKTYQTTQKFQNVYTMDLTNTVENIPTQYKGGAYNPVEALLGVGISVLKDKGKDIPFPHQK